jgi:hypothetical protein
MNNIVYKTYKGQEIDLSILTEIIGSEVIFYGKENIKLFIGTDSQNRFDSKETVFVTVLGLYRQGKGGRIFYKKKKDNLYKSVKQRMITEAYYSIQVAKEFQDFLFENDLEDLVDIPMEIHVDVNSDVKFKSTAALKEIRGYVTSMGYDCIIKPEAVAASNIADRFTH